MFRILFAEDDTTTRMTVAEYLRDEGYDVVDVRDGIYALEALKAEGPFDLTGAAVDHVEVVPYAEDPRASLREKLPCRPDIAIAAGQAGRGAPGLWAATRRPAGPPPRSHHANQTKQP